MAHKFFDWINTKIKSFDRFGIPILLNYNGENTYKTTIGGIGSIIISIILVIYSLVLFMQMVNNEGSIINSTTQIKNLMYDPTKYIIEIRYYEVFKIISLN